MAASRAFYESAFGWKFNDYGPVCSGIRSDDGEGEGGRPVSVPRGRRFEFTDPGGSRLGVYAEV